MDNSTKFARKYFTDNDAYILPTPNCLSGLKKLNIFVGANNSGKSRFLREMFSATDDSYAFLPHFNDKLKTIFTELSKSYPERFLLVDQFSNLEKAITGDYNRRYNEFIEAIESQAENGNLSQGNIQNRKVAEHFKNAIKDAGLPDRIALEDVSWFSVYIPILRGLRRLYDDVDVNTKKTEVDYEWEKIDQERWEIFSGLEMYTELKEMLLTSKEGREFLLDFEAYLKDNFFEDSSSFTLIIGDATQKDFEVNFGNGKSREIAHLGDGIQSIMIAVFKAFQYQDRQVRLFIEEPELTMHPSVQRVLIQALLEFPKLQIFLTTHSNHFLDLVYDYPEQISIFSFKQSSTEEKFEIENQNKQTQVLDLLGVRNSSVYLTNSVIWTEGVTDRMLIRKLLELKRGFDYKEDYHYAFAEYGGGNLANFDFLETNDDEEEKVRVSTISRKNYLIMDNDNKFEGDVFNRREHIKSLLGTDSVFDRHIEIENLIPYKVWLNVVEKMVVRKRIQMKSIDTSNEEEFNSRLSEEKIGILLKEYLIEPVEKDQPPLYYKADSIQCLDPMKKAVMAEVIEGIDQVNLTWADLPENAKELLNSIHNFVDGANSK